MAYPFFMAYGNRLGLSLLKRDELKIPITNRILLYFFFAFFLHLPFAQLIQTLLFGQFFGRYDF